MSPCLRGTSKIKYDAIWNAVGLHLQRCVPFVTTVRRPLQRFTGPININFRWFHESYTWVHFWTSISNNFFVYSAPWCLERMLKWGYQWMKMVVEKLQSLIEHFREQRIGVSKLKLQGRPKFPDGSENYHRPNGVRELFTPPDPVTIWAPR